MKAENRYTIAVLVLIVLITVGATTWMHDAFKAPLRGIRPGVVVELQGAMKLHTLTGGICDSTEGAFLHVEGLTEDAEFVLLFYAPTLPVWEGECREEEKIILPLETLADLISRQEEWKRERRREEKQAAEERRRQEQFNRAAEEFRRQKE